MVVNKWSLLCILTVVGDGMHENGKPCLLACRYWNGRNAKHLRKAVKVNLHASFFYNIHHIQRKYHWLAKFNKLQRQVQVAL